MDFNILDIQPHQVSRDLRGYSVFFYGDPKSGKTTIATKFPRHMLLAFEKGYNAIAGAMALPMNSWADFRKVLKQLKSPAAMEKYETIIIDTADIAYDLCERYVCANAPRADGGFGVDSIADIPYGKGYSMVAKEFDECLRTILQLNYGLVIISHAVDKTFKDEADNEFNQIVPTLDKRPRNIVSRMCDIIGYSRAVQEQDGRIVTKLFMRGTPRYVAGSRFKYTPDYINFTYRDLVTAISDAIDKQAEEDGEEFFTDERANVYNEIESEKDFIAMKEEFDRLTEMIMTNSSDEYIESFWIPKINQITDKYLGKGRKVSNCSYEQVEALELILEDLKDLIDGNSEKIAGDV